MKRMYLLSAADDPDIKIWDLNNLRGYSTISTEGDACTDGSIVYIAKGKIIGMEFRLGYIRFYNTYNRSRHLSSRQDIMTLIPILCNIYPRKR